MSNERERMSVRFGGVYNNYRFGFRNDINIEMCYSFNIFVFFCFLKIIFFYECIYVR